MTDIEILAKLNALELRVNDLDKKINHMVDVGDMLEFETHLYG